MLLRRAMPTAADSFDCEPGHLVAIQAASNTRLEEAATAALQAAMTTQDAACLRDALLQHGHVLVTGEQQVWRRPSAVPYTGDATAR